MTRILTSFQGIEKAGGIETSNDDDRGSDDHIGPSYANETLPADYHQQ